MVNVEIQIRTIAMDFRASLEHELAYKLGENKSDAACNELKACADEIADIDRRMQNLYNIAIDEQNPAYADIKDMLHNKLEELRKFYGDSDELNEKFLNDFLEKKNIKR